MSRRIEFIDNTEKFRKKNKEWLDFEKQIPRIEITATYDYLFSFWESFESLKSYESGQNKELAIIFYYKDDILKAIYPFCIISRKRKKILKFRSVEFIGQNFLTNYLDIITPGIELDDHLFVKKWMNSNLKYDFLHLSHIPEFSSSFKIFSFDNFYTYTHSAELLINPEMTYEDFKYKSYSKNYRQNVNTLYNRLKKSKLNYDINIKDFHIDDLKELQRLADYKVHTGKERE